MKFSGLICKYDKGVCITGLKLISEKNVTVNNLHRLPVIMSHFPSGSSTKNLLHFQQFTQKEEFKQFDYG